MVDLQDDELLQYCKYVLGLSHFAYQSRENEYHQQCSEARRECRRRGRLDIYEQAYRGVLGSPIPQWPDHYEVAVRATPAAEKPTAQHSRQCTQQDPCTPDCWQQAAQAVRRIYSLS